MGNLLGDYGGKAPRLLAPLVRPSHQKRGAILSQKRPDRDRERHLAPTKTTAIYQKFARLYRKQ